MIRARRPFPARAPDWARAPRDVLLCWPADIRPARKRRAISGPWISAAGERVEVRTTLNTVREKNAEVFNTWRDYHRACLAHAQCEGSDPARCAVPPQ